MADPTKWNDIHGKAQGAGIGGALGVVTVLGIELFATIDSAVAAILVASFAAIFSWLLPSTPPWKK
jgi:hypothetical protein